jgi:polyhydroxyalkanoate synthesis regulator phasin
MRKKDKKNKNKGPKGNAPETVGNTALKSQPEVEVVGPVSSSKFMEGVTGLVPGAPLPDGTKFKGDSEILSSLKEELEKDKTPVVVGTPLSTPVKLEPSPKVLTSATEEKAKQQTGQATVSTKTQPERGKTFIKPLTAASKKIQTLWETVKTKGFGKLKPDDDVFVLSQQDANVIQARITHLKKAVTSIAEYLSPEAYAHFTAHNKILELHFLSEIERECEYIIRFSR